MDDLKTHNSSLATCFLQIAHDLDASGFYEKNSTIFSEATIDQIIADQAKKQAHVNHAQEWKKLLLEINHISGFEHFLQPPNLSDLLAGLPQSGPVIILNIHKNQCDAIALISSSRSPLHISLNTFSLQQAIQLCNDIHQYLTDHQVHQREAHRETFHLHLHWQNPQGVIMFKVLHELWVHVAKPILDALNYLVCSVSVCKSYYY